KIRVQYIAMGKLHFIIFSIPIYSFLGIQAQDGILCFHVTGLQTCALPISNPPALGFSTNITSLTGLVSACTWDDMLVKRSSNKVQSRQVRNIGSMFGNVTVRVPPGTSYW